MSECLHQWVMTNTQFGFIVFEKCSHCDSLRTYFSNDDILDEYREGDCFWSIVENAQTIRFDLKCNRCDHLEKFDNLMGFLYCTGCLADCEVDILQKECEIQKTWIMVAFGFLPEANKNPIPSYKLDILTDYFNQRRDTSRSRIRIVSFNLIKDIPLCKGEFIHDVGMLSLQPKGRKPLL